VLVREGDLRGRRVLDLGAGTGRLAAALAEKAGCRVWAVDASAEMLEAARTQVPATVGLKQADAEALPFKDGWFERAVVRLSVHLWDRPLALAELRRVVSGRVAIATFDPVHFSGFWLNGLFPSFERIDRARFPDGPALERELRDAGFDEVRLVRLSQTAENSREDALAKIRGRHISTFDLIGDEEYELGLARAERELPERVESRLEWLIAVAD
jgi:SAM-dependent methyltransferase